MFFQFGGIALAFAGQRIKPYIKGIISESYLDWIEGNKLMFGMGCFLLGNILNNNKRVPNIETIIRMVSKYGGQLLKRY